jgi:hypothetical protein
LLAIQNLAIESRPILIPKNSETISQILVATMHEKNR